MTAWGLSPCLDHRWRWGWGRGEGVRVVRGDHARENWSNGCCRSGLSWRGLGRGRCGSMRNGERSTVDSRCSVLRIAWFGITWQQSISRVGETDQAKMKSTRSEKLC